MLRPRPLASTLAVLALLITVPALAETGEHAGYLADFGKDFDGTSKKLLDLAGAFPADHFSWRPAEGIRSVSESLVHVAGANFFLSQALGVPMPEGFSRDAEQTVTAKKDVIALLEKSQEHVRQALAKADPKALDKELELFGGKRSTRGVFMVIAGHSHEHLGQLIAYARSNDVVPPWSAAAATE